MDFLKVQDVKTIFLDLIGIFKMDIIDLEKLKNIMLIVITMIFFNFLLDVNYYLLILIEPSYGIGTYSNITITKLLQNRFTVLMKKRWDENYPFGNNGYNWFANI